MKTKREKNEINFRRASKCSSSSSRRRQLTTTMMMATGNGRRESESDQPIAVCALVIQNNIINYSGAIVERSHHHSFQSMNDEPKVNTFRCHNFIFRSAQKPNSFCFFFSLSSTSGSICHARSRARAYIIIRHTHKNYEFFVCHFIVLVCSSTLSAS